MSIRNYVAKRLAIASVYCAEQDASPDAYYDGTRHPAPGSRVLAKAKGLVPVVSRQLTVHGRTIATIARRCKPSITFGV